MKASVIFSLLTMTMSPFAMADFNLAHNRKVVVCYGEDNQEWKLNATRTTLKFTVEGESSGAEKITKTDTDGDTFVSYTSQTGTLRLDDQGDTFKFAGGEEAQSVRCK